MQITKSWALTIAVYAFGMITSIALAFTDLEIDDAKLAFVKDVILYLTGSTSAAGAFTAGLKHRREIKEIIKTGKDALKPSDEA